MLISEKTNANKKSNAIQEKVNSLAEKEREELKINETLEKVISHLSTSTLQSRIKGEAISSNLISKTTETLNDELTHLNRTKQEAIAALSDFIKNSKHNKRSHMKCLLDQLSMQNK